MPARIDVTRRDARGAAVLALLLGVAFAAVAISCSASKSPEPGCSNNDDCVRSGEGSWCWFPRSPACSSRGKCGSFGAGKCPPPRVRMCLCDGGEVEILPDECLPDDFKGYADYPVTACTAPPKDAGPLEGGG